MTWPTFSLSEICEIVSGATPKTSNPDFWDGGVPWVTPKDLSGVENKHISDSPRKISEIGLKSCSTSMLPPGSILFSSRAPIGLVAINTVPVCTNQGFKSLVPRNERVHADYLYWWLKINQANIQRKGRGATFKEVSKRIVGSIQIPLPPLGEQKWIAAILDAADALRQKRRESLANLDSLLQSTFLDLFGDPATNPMKWPMVKMEELGATTQYGTSQAANDDEVGIPILRMNNVTSDGRIDLSKMRWVDMPTEDAQKYTTERGDLLFNRTNSPELVGKAAVWNRDESFAIAGYLVRVRFDRTLAHPDYVSGFLNSHYGKCYLAMKAMASNNMSNFSASRFRKIPLPKPPLELQLRYAAIVESVEQLNLSQRAHLTELDNLFASLHQRAFSGALSVQSRPSSSTRQQ